MDRKSAKDKTNLAALTVGALGVVYGDIGTSPLYAVRESLMGLPVSPLNVFGVLSLIFWSLILVISIKYLMLILRADNDGEGGMLALLALLKRKNGYHPIFFLFCVVGAGLLLGDGMLTPAISVLSAIEGLEVITPHLSHWVIPLTISILILLFLFQRFGSAKIGGYFGPILIVWFFTLAALGLYRILENPAVIKAINPYYAYEFFYDNGWKAYILLGGVFLVVTGGEALYADLGHFGKTPIRFGWYFVALPSLLLNYFGQGAYLLNFPGAIVNPFYSVAPDWFSFPLLILATLATIIASQAVISAAFSIARQAVLLDLLPRLPIIQTSESKIGQIYVPQMNFILLVGTILLVLTFQNTTNLTHAYGIAVNLEMVMVTILVARVAYRYWKWSSLRIFLTFSLFLTIDLSFLGANSLKFFTGGWVPLLFAMMCGFIMWTWHKGLKHMRTTYYREKADLKQLIPELDYIDVQCLPNSTIIFIADPYDNSGGGLLHYLKLNRILPERILIVSVKVENHPYISRSKRYEMLELRQGIYRLILHYGFMDRINITTALVYANKMKLFSFDLDVRQATYLIEIPNVIATRKKRTLLFFWQEQLFAFLSRNAVLDIEFFHLPYNRTIAIGNYCEI